MRAQRHYQYPKVFRGFFIKQSLLTFSLEVVLTARRLKDLVKLSGLLCHDILIYIIQLDVAAILQKPYV